MTSANRVRTFEARQKERGLREIRVWVPDDPAAISSVRQFCADLCQNPPKAPTNE